MPQHPHGADAVRNALYAADSVSPDVAGQSSEHVCPQCSAPGSCAAPHCRPTRELDFSGVPLVAAAWRVGVVTGRGIRARSDILCRCKGCGELYNGRHGARDPLRQDVVVPAWNVAEEQSSDRYHTGHITTIRPPRSRLCTITHRLDDGVHVACPSTWSTEIRRPHEVDAYKSSAAKWWKA